MCARRRGRTRRAALLGAAALAFGPAWAAGGAPALPPYPAAPRDSVVDDFHGVAVPDPYRWLEADPRTTPQVRDWIAAENRYSARFLAAIPQRAAIRRRLAELFAMGQRGPTIEAGGLDFYRWRGPDDEQAALWVSRGDHGAKRKLLDPNAWSADGSVALAADVPDGDGRLVAYAVQKSGEDWRVWRVLDVASGKPRADEISWNKFTDVIWAPDASGFYYTRFPQPAPGQALRAANSSEGLYFHRLGEPQSADRLIYQDTRNPDYMFAADLSDDGRYLVVNTGYDGGGAGLLVKDLVAGGDFKPIALAPPDALTSYRFVGAAGSRLFLETNVAAPNRRVVSVDLAKPDAPPRDVVPETSDPLIGATLAGGRLFAVRLHDDRAQVDIYDETGRLAGRAQLPAAGVVSGFHGAADAKSILFQFSNFTTPWSTYRYDIASGRVHLVFRPRGPYDPRHYGVEERFAPLPDGRRAPVFIAYRKGALRRGATPTILYGYGGFGANYPPDFRPQQTVWMDMGGAYAIVALPGDGTYGEAWRKSGMLEHKPAVFDAFNAAAQYLIECGLTNPHKLAAFGYSNGGLTVAAAMERRPDLYAAAMPTVGVLDLLGFTRFTNGRLWTSEFGDPQDPRMFRVLMSYSPYHNIAPGRSYPAMLIGAAAGDDRVAPMHSFKFAARMQAEAAHDHPVLLEVESHAGHGAGNARSKTAAEAADRLAFLLRVMDMKLPAGFGGP